MDICDGSYTTVQDIALSEKNINSTAINNSSLISSLLSAAVALLLKSSYYFDGYETVGFDDLTLHGFYRL